MKLNFKYFVSFSFWLEFLLFAFTLFLAIGIASNYIAQGAVQTNEQVSQVSFWQFIIAFLIATAILLLILRFVKRPWLVQVLFYFAIIEGLWLFSQAYFPWPSYLLVMVFLVFYWLFYRNVAMHNIVIVLSTSAIAVLFGLYLTPSTAIIIVLFLAAYDFIAVYKTKHMVQMFRGLAQAKVHFAIIIPFSYKGLFNKINTVSPGTEFMFLGTGDLAVPAIFVVAALGINLQTALITALGAILGFLCLYVIFVSQDERQPMPGLPPIVFGTLVGFMVALLIR